MSTSNRAISAFTYTRPEFFSVINTEGEEDRMFESEGKRPIATGKDMSRLSLALLLVVLALPVSVAQSCGQLRAEGGTGRDHQEVPCILPPMPPPLPLHAIDRIPGPGPEPPFYLEHISDLSLDEKQLQSIREIKSRTMKNDIRKNAEVMVARMELADIIFRTPMDFNAVEAKLNQIAALDVAIQLSHLKAMAEVESRLSPEQRRRLASVRQVPPLMKRMHSCDSLNDTHIRRPGSRRQKTQAHTEPAKAE